MRLGFRVPLPRRLHRVGGLFSLLLSLVCFGACGWRVWTGLREVLTFEPVPGTVTEYLCPDDTYANEADRRGRISYAYTAQGEAYVGTYPADAGAAQTPAPLPVLRQPHRVGDQIAVYYDPTDPARSTPAPRIDPGTLPFFTFVLPFSVLGCILLFRPRAMTMAQRTGSARRSPLVTFLGTYFMLSAVFTFAQFFVMQIVSWRAACVVGVAVPTVVVPGLVLLTTWWIRRRTAERAGQQPSPTEEHVFARRREAVVLGAMCLFWWGLGSIFLVDLCLFWAQYAHARATYETAPGVIARNVVIEGRTYSAWEFSHHHSSHSVHIDYQYEVAGETYTGNRLFIRGARWKQDARAAAHWSDTYPPGTEVTVHYDPGDPGQSVLEFTVPRYRWIETPLLLVHATFGLAVLVAFVSALRKALAPASSKSSAPRKAGRGGATAAE